MRNAPPLGSKRMPKPALPATVEFRSSSRAPIATSMPVPAFDATVVIVSLSARQEARASRLVGACLTETDAPRGAALAVLNATNRILGNLFATR
jgi:hypothetical protein